MYELVIYLLSQRNTHFYKRFICMRNAVLRGRGLDEARRAFLTSMTEAARR